MKPNYLGQRDKPSENVVDQWISLLVGAPTRGTIDSVFDKISAAVSREVLGSWGKVFGRPVSAKRIDIDWNIDPSKEDMPYAFFPFQMVNRNMH